MKVAAALVAGAVVGLWSGMALVAAAGVEVIGFVARLIGA